MKIMSKKVSKGTDESNNIMSNNFRSVCVELAPCCGASALPACLPSRWLAPISASMAAEQAAKASAPPPPQPLRSQLTPERVEGTLMKEDRDRIFAETDCSVATRDRGKGRCLSVAGPPDKLAKAREMALEACARNQKYFEDHGQSSNPGHKNAAGDDARVQEGHARQKAHQSVEGASSSASSWRWQDWGSDWWGSWSGWPSDWSSSWSGWPSSSWWQPDEADWSESGWPSPPSKPPDTLLLWNLQKTETLKDVFHFRAGMQRSRYVAPRLRFCSIGIFNVPGQLHVQF